MNHIGHLVNGKIIEKGDPTQDVFNPSSGKVEKQVLMAGKRTVGLAIQAATEAFPAWRNTPAIKRARIMFEFRRLLERNHKKICRIIGEEHGKITHDAAGELQRGIENVEYACFAPELLKGEHSRNVAQDVDSWSEFQPLGVVAGITPFNFPAMVPLWMYPLAIVCGNCFVLKPSERDPGSALFIAQLLQQAGLPNGVLNVVNGGKEAVDTLLSDSRIEAVSFVGSTPIAEYIYSSATSHGKRCQALGGAKNHAIIMPDADIDNAVNQLLGAAFGSSGERCMAISVAVAVGDQTGDALASKMKAAMDGLRVGPFYDSENNFGPVITREHLIRIIGYIDSAEEQGAKIILDGRQPHVEGHEDGFYIGGTLIDRVRAEMDSYKAETFWFYTPNSSSR